MTGNLGCMVYSVPITVSKTENIIPNSKRYVCHPQPRHYDNGVLGVFGIPSDTCT